MTDTLVFHDGAGGIGGAERLVVTLANEFDADLLLGYTNGNKQWFAERHDSVYTLGYDNYPPRLRDLRVLLHASQTVYKKYDTVITSGPTTKFYQPYDLQDHYHYMHHPPEQDVLWYDGGFVSYLAGIADTFETKRVPTLIANSETTARRIKHQYRETADHIVYPPVETERFTPAQTRTEGQFVLVGRLVERKRPEIAIDAFRQVPDAELVVCGDGPQREELMENAPQNVTFKGYVPDDELASIIEQSEGAISVARGEHFGIVTAEYLAAGTPVVAVDEPHTNVLVDHGETGVLVPATTSGIAAGVESVQAESWDYDAISKRASQYSEARFRQRMRQIIEASGKELSGGDH